MHQEMSETGVLRRRLERRNWSRLHQPDRMRELLDRERARSMRSGRQFSLVIFRARGGPRPSVSTLRLAQAILSRVREIDDIGWLDERRLCAILPYTCAAGVRRFAESVCAQLAGKSPRPRCVVYTYPSHGIQSQGAGQHSHPRQEPHNGNGNGNGNGHDNGHPAHRPAPKPASPEPDWLGAPDEHSLREVTGPDLGRGILPAGALEDFFIRPMPLWKRLIDISGAAMGLVAACPVLLLTAAAVKLSSPGPVLFQQRRMGLGGRPFVMLKFRTMVVDAEHRKAALRALSEQDGPAFKLSNDPRVTLIGQFLRQASLDELPQLWNVLRGEMSLVGPRPLPLEEAGACAAWHQCRLDVTPGLTCVWQATGRSQVTFAEWMRMDIGYIRRRNFLTDLKILLMTIPAVLLRKGAR